MTSQNHVPAKPAEPASLSKSDFQNASVSIQPETGVDHIWIEKLHGVCFGPGRFARAAFRIREQFPPDLAASFVAKFSEKPVGSVRMTRISLSEIEGYLLGPLAIDPLFHNKGAGRVLVTTACKAGFERRAKFILLVGDAAYYSSMGFEAITANAIVFPGPVDPARILVRCDSNDIAEKLGGEISASLLHETKR